MIDRGLHGDGSQTRRREDPGVFYGAEEREAACAEAGYWRLRFWNESAFLSKQSKSILVTLFEFQAATKRALDLNRPPLVEDRGLWMLPDNYSATQALANNARQANAEVLRYESVRRPNGRCLAFSGVLDLRFLDETEGNGQVFLPRFAVGGDTATERVVQIVVRVSHYGVRAEL